MEYTQQVEDKPGEFEMIEASSSCKISIVTKRYRISENNTRYITSIWAMSDDRSVRLQQKRTFAAVYSNPETDHNSGRWR